MGNFLALILHGWADLANRIHASFTQYKPLALPNNDHHWDINYKWWGKNSSISKSLGETVLIEYFFFMRIRQRVKRIAGARYCMHATHPHQYAFLVWFETSVLVQPSHAAPNFEIRLGY